MSIRKFITIAALGMSAIGAMAADQEPIVGNPNDLPKDAKQPVTPTLELQVDTTFPDSDVFGVKLVNNHATTAHVSIINGEADPVTVRMIGGSLWPLDTADKPKNQVNQAVRNLTTTNYGVEIPAGQNVSLAYSFATELHPQELRLLLAAIVMDKKGNGFQVEAYNRTVSVVEAPLSIFDPQMLFLYILLTAGFAGTVYFIYNTWVKTLFPQAKKSGSRRTKSAKAAPASGALSSGDEKGSATGSGKGYDESWIGAHHLQRPEAKRVRSGTPKTRAK